MSRPFLTLVHRYLGLSLALFLAIAGLTGAVISWDRELDAWLNPELFAANSQGQVQDSLALVQALERQRPELVVSSFPLAATPGRSWLASVEPRDADQTLGYNQVVLDPVSAEIRGQRQWGAVSLARPNLVSFVYKLHYSLHLPSIWGFEPGVILMGALAIVWCIDSLIALWISFPNRQHWRKSLRFRLQQGSHKRVFDLHRSGGVWFFPLLLVIAFTSVAMNLRNELVRPLVSLFSPLTPTPFETRSPGAQARVAAVSRQEIVQTAQAKAVQLGIERPLGSMFYSSAYGIYGVSFFASDMDEGGLGKPWLYFDGASGDYISAHIPGQGSAGDIFMQAQFPLHSGRVLGFAGRVLVSAVGLLVALLSVTGVIIWARKRRARRGGTSTSRCLHNWRRRGLAPVVHQAAGQQELAGADRL